MLFVGFVPDAAVLSLMAPLLRPANQHLKDVNIYLYIYFWGERRKEKRNQKEMTKEGVVNTQAKVGAELNGWRMAQKVLDC